jgi:DNA-binding HxlR family transcriptional regulator
MALLDLLGRRWALRVIWELREGHAPTFRELQARCGGVSSSVLSQRLQELGDADVVLHDGVGYRLSDAGRDLLNRLEPLDDWASRWRPTAKPKGGAQ